MHLNPHVWLVAARLSCLAMSCGPVATTYLLRFWYFFLEFEFFFIIIFFIYSILCDLLIRVTEALSGPSYNNVQNRQGLNANVSMIKCSR